MFMQCRYCEGDRIVALTENTPEGCPLCNSAGVLELEREDIAVPVDMIRDVLTPILRRNPDLDDALADAHPQLVDLILKWG
jgi:hypothetical protein